jgi:hypothetical protein
MGHRPYSQFRSNVWFARGTTVRRVDGRSSIRGIGGEKYDPLRWLALGQLFPMSRDRQLRKTELPRDCDDRAGMLSPSGKDRTVIISSE